MPAPTIRGSGIQEASASSYTVSWPAGTLAGDLAVIFGQHGFHYTTPANWAQIDNTVSSPVSGMVIAKLLTAADIATGSVTIAASGTYNGSLGIVTFIGGGFTAFSIASAGTPAPGTSFLATLYAPANSIGLYWGGTRSTPGSTNTVSIGSVLQTTSNTESSASIYSQSFSVAATPNPVFSFSTSGGYYVAAVFVQDVGGGGGGGGGAWTFAG